MEQHDLLHSPDFSAPDFSQPALEKVAWSAPTFVEPNPQASPYGPWPLVSAALPGAENERPDPALPNLQAPERPDTLIYPAEQAHTLSGPAYEPEKSPWQRPGEPDPAARALLLGSPDEAALPPQLTYAQLYSRDDAMSRRKRHFAMLEPGLVESERDDDGR